MLFFASTAPEAPPFVLTATVVLVRVALPESTWIPPAPGAWFPEIVLLLMVTSPRTRIPPCGSPTLPAMRLSRMFTVPRALIPPIAPLFPVTATRLSVIVAESIVSIPPAAVDEMPFRIEKSVISTEIGVEGFLPIMSTPAWPPPSTTVPAAPDPVSARSPVTAMLATTGLPCTMIV